MTLFPSDLILLHAMVSTRPKDSMSSQIKKMLTWTFLKSLLTDPAKLPFTAAIIIITEIILNVFIVERVPYTEIDWKAYMQECEGFLNGTLDYSKLRGDTGPLVYPAGFVYIYSLFYFITNSGENIKLAQYIFLVIYILHLALVFRLYIKSRKVPPFVLLITILSSYRIHSIYVLRLFNDPIAVLLLYFALNFFVDSKWYLGSLFFSLAVSVKMNILLYAPALFFFYLINLGLKKTFEQLAVCGAVQLLLGLPFLLTYPVEYVKGSFDFGRVFNHTWTVNYRFLDIPAFENKCFHLTLLGIHIMLLLIFIPMFINYFRSYCRLKYVQRQVQPQIDVKNFEIRKLKGKKIAKKIAEKKGEKDTEPISKQQEDFLASFESMLQKQKGMKKDKSLGKAEEPAAPSLYSINYDVLSQLFLLPMFVTNFIGIVCARSLHYQFYSWYFHSLPYLLWSNNYSIIVRFLLLALIEFCWNTYPSTIFSSLLLHACHITVLYGVYRKLADELKVISKVQ